MRICEPARARLGGYGGGPGSACTSGMDAAIRRHGLCAASCAASQLPEVRDGCAELPLLLSQMPEVVVPFTECLHSVRRWVVSDGRGRPALRRQRTSRKQTIRRKPTQRQRHQRLAHRRASTPAPSSVAAYFRRTHARSRGTGIRWIAPRPRPPHPQGIVLPRQASQRSSMPVQGC